MSSLFYLCFLNFLCFIHSLFLYLSHTRKWTFTLSSSLWIFWRKSESFMRGSSKVGIGWLQRPQKKSRLSISIGNKKGSSRETLIWISFQHFINFKTNRLFVFWQQQHNTFDIRNLFRWQRNCTSLKLNISNTYLPTSYLSNISRRWMQCMEVCVPTYLLTNLWLHWRCAWAARERECTYMLYLYAVDEGVFFNKFSI